MPIAFAASRSRSDVTAQRLRRGGRRRLRGQHCWDVHEDCVDRGGISHPAVSTAQWTGSGTYPNAELILSTRICFAPLNEKELTPVGFYSNR